MLRAAVITTRTRKPGKACGSVLQLLLLLLFLQPQCLLSTLPLRLCLPLPLPLPLLQLPCSRLHIPSRQGLHRECPWPQPLPLLQTVAIRLHNRCLLFQCPLLHWKYLQLRPLPRIPFQLRG